MRYVVVGLHAAGRSACMWLRKVDKSAEIIGIDPSPLPVYSRPLISYVLAGEMAPRDMVVAGDGFWKEQGVTVLADRALALDPEILFLDEPSAGLDPVSARMLDDLILELRDALGTTFVIVSHELASIFAIASNGIYLDVRTRRVTARGNPSELVRDPHTELQALRFLTRGEAGGPQQQD